MVAIVEKDRQCHELVLEILLLIVHSSPLLCLSLDGKLRLICIRLSHGSGESHSFALMSLCQCGIETNKHNYYYYEI